MTEKRYHAGTDLEACCKILNVDLESVLSESNISLNEIDISTLTMTATEFATAFMRMLQMYGKDDFHIRMVEGYIKSPVGAAHIGFIASSTIKEGIERIAKIKGTMLPTGYKAISDADSTSLSMFQTHPSFPINGFAEITTYLWIVKSCRNYSLQTITPQRIVLTSDITYREQIEEELGCKIEIGTESELVFDAETAHIPLFTKSDFIAQSIDSEVSRRIKKDEESSITILASRIIRLMLASGSVTSERVSKELAMSKRTFERRLNSEGTSFRSLVNQIKSELSIEYLANKNYSVAEISFMLGFDEPNSFFRAFKRWHGKTPSQIRNISNHVA